MRAYVTVYRLYFMHCFHDTRNMVRRRTNRRPRNTIRFLKYMEKGVDIPCNEFLKLERLHMWDCLDTALLYAKSIPRRLMTTLFHSPHTPDCLLTLAAGKYGPRKLMNWIWNQLTEKRLVPPEWMVRRIEAAMAQLCLLSAFAPDSFVPFTIDTVPFVPFSGPVCDLFDKFTRLGVVQGWNPQHV